MVSGLWSAAVFPIASKKLNSVNVPRQLSYDWHDKWKDAGAAMTPSPQTGNLTDLPVADQHLSCPNRPKHVAVQNHSNLTDSDEINTQNDALTRTRPNRDTADREISKISQKFWNQSASERNSDRLRKYTLRPLAAASRSKRDALGYLAAGPTSRSRTG